MVSHFKKNWNFEDYPIKTWKNPNAGEKKVAYGAGIINWAIMVGHGESSEKALIALKDKFKQYKEKNDILPRPGKTVQIKFASSEKMDRYEKTAVDFFKNILEINYYDGFFSDVSSLSDFEWGYRLSNDEELVNQYRDKIIKQVFLFYNVDITEMYDEPLWKIFEIIENKK